MVEHRPEGWASARVEELFDWWGGMTPSTGIQAYWGGTTPWVSSKDLKSHGVNAETEMVTDRALRETRLRKCRPGTLLTVVRSGVLVHTLPVAIADRELVINQDLKAFDSGDDDVNRWLAVYLRAHERAILDENRKDGTTVQSIRVQQLAQRSIPLPPIAEQRRIVEKVEALLGRVSAAREQLERVARRLKRFRQAVLAAACEGRLTETWRERAGIKGVWEEAPLKELAVAIQYGYTASASQRADGPRFLRITDIQDGRVNWDAVPSCAISRRDTITFALRSGDIVFARSGATTGKSFLVEDCPEAVFASYLIRVRAGPRVRPRFLAIYFQSPAYWNHITGSLAGNAQPNCNASKLAELLVPIPTAAEQEEIVRRIQDLFSLADGVERRVATGHALASKLPQVLLSRAFAGGLVPTEAELARTEGRDYETAEGLLERLRRAREASGGRKEGRGAKGTSARSGTGRRSA